MQFAICWVYAIKSRHSCKICLSSKLLQVNSNHCFLHDSITVTCDARDELEAQEAEAREFNELLDEGEQSSEENALLSEELDASDENQNKL